MRMIHCISHLLLTNILQADVTINTISSAVTTVNHSHLITDLSVLNGPVIHVRVTALDPDISYTTLPVNMNTTAHEVVFTIMEKHGKTSCYSAKEFYLVEVSYNCHTYLHDSDKVRHVLTKLSLQTSQMQYIVQNIHVYFYTEKKNMLQSHAFIQSYFLKLSIQHGDIT